MKYLYEEVAYLKGLAEGLEISEETKEGKIINKIVDVLESFADAIVELEEEQIELIDYVESIDEDLSDIEDDIYEEDEDDEDDDEEYNYIEMECPNCNDFVEIDEDLLYNEDIDIVCPNCQAVILSSEDECECSDECICDCDCHEEK
ncbi:CD1247 N-terminal domain-containing protein [Paraclostridium sp. AKS81]|uniref:CD1247 N-terminal domain-containing protein n=1 Tax=Paraclostridium sp. AKS81 TaxID=2876117 RepID=UPI0021DFEE4A|nr:CD1247 N-terminal domain-containing protein [Paraclostridium sp. AKS81]MCU9810397.1 zinc ribbon domain-containing protein [Paraclostridium sp. AKS81]